MKKLADIYIAAIFASVVAFTLTSCGDKPKEKTPKLAPLNVKRYSHPNGRYTVDVIAGSEINSKVTEYEDALGKKVPLKKTMAVSKSPFVACTISMVDNMDIERSQAGRTVEEFADWSNEMQFKHIGGKVGKTETIQRGDHSVRRATGGIPKADSEITYVAETYILEESIVILESLCRANKPDAAALRERFFESFKLLDAKK